MPLKFTCPNCQKDIILQYLGQGQIAKCRHCGAEVPVPEDAEEITTEQAVEYADKLRSEGQLPGMDIDRSPHLTSSHRRKVGFMRVIAWCILIAGIYIGIAMMGGGFFLMYAGAGGPEAIGMGVMIIIQTVAIFGILLVIAMIAESLVDMQGKMAELIKINREKEES